MTTSPRANKSLRPWWVNPAATVTAIVVTILLLPPTIVLNVRSAWCRGRLRRAIRRTWPAAVRFLVRDDEDEWSALLRREWLPRYAAVTILVPPAVGSSAPSAEEELARRVLDEWGRRDLALILPLAVVVAPGKRPQAVHIRRDRRLLEQTRSAELRQHLDGLLAVARSTVHSTE